MLSVRIVTSDHSMDDPIPGLDVTYSSFRGTVVKKVPVIRIFGPDSAGVKTCLHIHGVFPYIFIPCVEAEPDGKMQYQLASSLDLALNISLGQTSSTSQHVFKVVLVSGTPFYGYHQNSHQFYKIFFYNPQMVKKAAELLQSGAILNKVYQVHHCHIPYNLQFFIDYNLRGMDYISLEAVKYRRHPSTCLTPDWANEDMLLPAHVPRLSVSEVEADGMAGDIMNVRTMSLKMNPGLEDIWNDEKQRRRKEFRSSQITPPSSQQRPECAPTESEIFFKNRIQENLRLMRSQQQESSSSINTSSMENSTSINSSIPYPVEVPKGVNLINASYLDSHAAPLGNPSNSHQSSHSNESFVDERMVLSLLSGSQKRSQNVSVILDSQDMMFADVLGELHDEQARVDDDSILGSQLERDCPDDDGDFLSDNHEIVNTVLEENVQINSDGTASQETRQMWQESFWSGVDANCVVPQLDGTLESPDSTPGTSSNEQPMLDLAQAPNYWPFPELAALEPCNEGIHNNINRNCEEDLMDLSYSTATYSNISEPYNRVLLGDPALTLPPSATPSELGDCIQISNEFANNDQNFEGELMENLNFPDIGDLLEPNLDYSPIKVRPFYAAEMNGTPAKKQLSKASSKRKHSKANKAAPIGEQLKGTLGEPAIDYTGTGTDGTADIFQQPQQPVPCTNGSYFYQMIPPSMPNVDKSVKKAKVAKKVASKKKTSAMPLSTETTENDIQASQDDPIVPVKKVTTKRKSTSATPCTGASCYEDSINRVIIRALEELDSANAESISPSEGNHPSYLSDSSATVMSAPQQNFVDALPTTPLESANVATIAARHEELKAKELVNSEKNECAEKEDVLQERNQPTSSQPIQKLPTTVGFTKDTNMARIENPYPANAGFNTFGRDNSILHGNQISTEVKPAGLNTIGTDHLKSLCKQPDLAGAWNNSIGNVLHNKTLPSISITAVKRNYSDVPDQTLSNDPSVLRTKSLPGISLTAVNKNVNKKKAVPSINPKIIPDNAPDTCSMVAIGNVKKTSVPKILRTRPPISSLYNTSVVKKRDSESLPSIKLESEELLQNNLTVPNRGDHQELNVTDSAKDRGTKSTLEPDPLVTKTLETKAHAGSPPPLVPLEDDLAPAQINKQLEPNKVGKKKTNVNVSAKQKEPKLAKVAKLKPEPLVKKPLEATSHARSPLALVRREDDLSLADLIRFRKAKEKCSPTTTAEERKCSQDEKNEFFEVAISKTTTLMVERSANVEVLHGDSQNENICVLDERSTMTVKDKTHDNSGVDCCLKVVKSSLNSISLADLIKKVTDAYKSPIPTRLTFFKDMCKQKFHFESVEIQAVNRPINNTPESGTAEIKTLPDTFPSTSNVKERKIRKHTVKKNKLKKKKGYKLELNGKQKAPLLLASREIVDARLVALFESRTGETINPSKVSLERASATLLAKYRLRNIPKKFKIPCVDGGVDSDLSSSDDEETSTSQPVTPKRHKGRYRPLAVQYEKSPKGEASKSAARSPSNGVGRSKRQKRGSYSALDVRFDKSPSSRRPSQVTAGSSSFGIQPNSCKDTAKSPDSITKHLSSDDLESSNCRISQSKCDDTISVVQSEMGCDQNISNEDSTSKTAKKKLTFPGLSVNQINIASNSLETSISETFPARRYSYDMFGESDSPQMFTSSGDTASGSHAQSPIDTNESIGALELVSDDDINDLGIVSFYDNTHILTSPTDYTFHGSPESSDIASSAEPLVTKLPVSVRESTHLAEPAVYHQEPFYSDPSDVTAGIQVGHRIIKLLCGPSTRIPHDQKPVSVWAGKATITPCQIPPSYAEVERWTKARKLLKKQEVDVRTVEKPDETKSPSSQGTTVESLSKASISLVTESPPSPKINQEEFTNATSTPQNTRRTRIASPTYTPIVDIKAKLRSSKRKSLATRSFKPQEPSIEEVDESETPKESPVGSPKPSTSKETPRRLTQRRRSSVNSIEDPSLHKLLLQSQFRQQLASPRRLSSGCQIEGVQNNTFGFRMSLENLQDAKALTQHQHLTVMSMELHLQTRGDMRPDPAHDPIRAVFYFVVNDVPDSSSTPKHEAGGLAVCDNDDFLVGCGLEGRLRGVTSERELIDEVVTLVRRTDPDIFCGYETEMLSWGYLIQRAATLQINLCPLLSRMPTLQREGRRDIDEADGTMDGPSDLRLPGRVLLNVWRLMKSEIALMNYSFENVVFHVLHQRVPLHSFRSLSNWWEHRSKRFRWLTADYYETRVRGMVRVMDQLDLIGRTSELARLFGIQFYEVFSRGSQFRVESMMLRLAKPLDYVPVSPSIHQRAQMRAPECVPLIMEPESAFYADPVIVLDFQSLYPSIIIAYNYCFSTCLGRVEHLGKREPFAFGCTSLKVPPKLVGKLFNKMNVSPNGVAFVQEKVRRGVLPRMLQEILDTRLMVKKSMKEHADDKTLQRVLHSRQLGLKLIANVTYGYTSANFSGRMPCVEVGDSVVSKGRETLERAIRLVQQTERWGAKVVYGDTDSLFVLVKGRSREQAFAIGAEIAEAVTRDNPKPVKLKLEKVYHPCILQTKKRYVGYLYESPEQREPRYDAKGIETVRRDGCPAVAKMLEKCLRLLFETRDASLVKRYVCRQFDKLLRGRANIQDLVFAREYRGMAGYKPGACVPALELTRRWIHADRRSEPRVGERVPYVIVAGAPGLPLIRLVRSPHELISDSSLRINAVYYITRAIVPALNRCLLLIGADTLAWFATMPRKVMSYLPTSVTIGQKKSTISQYFATTDCAACARPTNTGLCTDCATCPQTTVLVLHDKVRQWERNLARITQVCESCVGRSYSIDCMTLDCPVMFRKHQAFRDLEQAPFVRQLIDQF